MLYSVSVDYYYCEPVLVMLEFEYISGNGHDYSGIVGRTI